MKYDVVIVGGGPAGLSAALALGRARKSVMVCDSGPRRNAAATYIQNFVTRDGTPPDDFRRTAREQLARYSGVSFSDARVRSISGSRGAFHVDLGSHAGSHAVQARRILLATGMVDEMLPIPGFRELWGQSIFQCPYCHGWEVQDRPWGYLALPENLEQLLPFALKMPGWSHDVTVFTGGAFELARETREKLTTARVRIETAPIARLLARGNQLEAIELENKSVVRCEALFTHPPQKQVALVTSLGVALDAKGYVCVDPTRRETSIPGIYASGDLTTRLHGAIFAAASGTQAATSLNTELSMDLALAKGATLQGLPHVHDGTFG